MYFHPNCSSIFHKEYKDMLFSFVYILEVIILITHMSNDCID